MWVTNLPLLLVVIVIVFLWSFNGHRKRVRGVGSNFQPLLSALMLLLLAACLPSAVEFALSIHRKQPAPDKLFGAMATFYLIGLVFALKIPFFLSGLSRSRLLRPRPREKTAAGFPLDESER